MRLAVIIIALAFACPVQAEIRPQPGPGDPRIQSVVYDAEQVVQLDIATGYQLTVEFAADERIENVAVGNAAAWSVTPNRRGDRLFIKAVQGEVASNLTVVTDARTYAFELNPAFGAQGNLAYTVRFEYKPVETARPAPVDMVGSGTYRLSGAKQLRPSQISDDGQKTYLVFRDDVAMPAIFAVDQNGNERLVDGAVRDDIYVVDSVSDRLIFRIGKQAAKAVRTKKLQR
jgi:type IV secretion system protein VirB9